MPTSPSDDFTMMGFCTYWKTYFPDLIEPLRPHVRQLVLENLLDGFIDEVYAGRATVQRVIEAHTGVITAEQYISWSMSDEWSDGSEHVLAHLVDGEYVGGDRAAMLSVLGHIDYTDSFAQRMRWAAQRGLLSQSEVNRILATSLRLPPLPRLKDVPEGLPQLPFTRVRVLGEWQLLNA